MGLAQEVIDVITTKTPIVATVLIDQAKSTPVAKLIQTPQTVWLLHDLHVFILGCMTLAQ